MTHKSLKVTLIASIFFAVGGIVARYLFIAPELNWNAVGFGPDYSSLGPDAEDELDLTIASPDLPPERVVELQVQALNGASADPHRLVVCYSLASPSNRAMTGPFSRFSQMVVAPPYDHLLAAVDWQVGQAEIVDNVASVLVSVATAQGEAYAYRFYLSKQTEPPLEQCWMTDGVEPVAKLDFASLRASSPQEGPVDPIQESGAER